MADLLSLKGKILLGCFIRNFRLDMIIFGWTFSKKWQCDTQQQQHWLFTEVLLKMQALPDGNMVYAIFDLREIVGFQELRVR